MTRAEATQRIWVISRKVRARRRLQALKAMINGQRPNRLRAVVAMQRVKA